ncbi:hypothetical protein [Kushneria marisflavi]|uniref:hypothetical protein n=1 Tax=Kushneria marisflavi TaxID=157779 RepID=UPI001F2C7DB8|nr:hypothetical protein [Kushneria marisflavi]
MMTLLLSSSISAGGLAAMVLNLLLPDHAAREQAVSAVSAVSAVETGRSST